MKISIMLTSYNLVDYIDTSVQSVIDLEKPCDWELLIGDDGSIDGTVEKIKAWVDKYPDNIKLFQIDRTKETGLFGARAAKNRAMLLEKATGDYLNFLDGDDEFIGTEKLRKQLELLEQPEFVGCSCSAHNIIANDIQSGTNEPMFDIRVQMRIFSAKQYWPELYFHTNTILFRKKCKSLLLDKLYRDYLNDTFITYCLLQFGDILYIPDLYVRYNLTGQGLWTGKSRVYGCFRNLMLYDLEMRINPKLAKESFVHHLYDFNVIRNQYTVLGQDGVDKLVAPLSPEIFRYTFMMYNLNNKSEKEVSSRQKLFRKVISWTTCIRAKHLFRKLFQ